MHWDERALRTPQNQASLSFAYRLVNFGFESTGPITFDFDLAPNDHHGRPVIDPDICSVLRDRTHLVR